MNTTAEERSSTTATATAPDYNPKVRCALCRSAGFVARYCPCTKAGERRLFGRNGTPPREK